MAQWDYAGSALFAEADPSDYYGFLNLKTLFERQTRSARKLTRDNLKGK